jgi:hypothetical protein
MNIVIISPWIHPWVIRVIYLFVCFFNTPSHKEAHVTCRVILHELFSMLVFQSREKSEPLKGACNTAVIFL